MFDRKEIQTKLEKLEASLTNDTLWLGAAPPEERIDFLSVLEEGALELHKAGHRAGGDPVWISAMIDAGWPEWLVMLLLGNRLQAVLGPPQPRPHCCYQRLCCHLLLSRMQPVHVCAH